MPYATAQKNSDKKTSDVTHSEMRSKPNRLKTHSSPALLHNHPACFTQSQTPCITGQISTCPDKLASIQPAGQAARQAANQQINQSVHTLLRHNMSILCTVWPKCQQILQQINPPANLCRLVPVQVPVCSAGKDTAPCPSAIMPTALTAPYPSAIMPTLLPLPQQPRQWAFTS
jgi:hypothetical protein